MTKCIVLGKDSKEESKKKLIEFVKIFAYGAWKTTYSKPIEWGSIELICKSYNNDAYDLMFAYDSDRNLGRLYLGHWNDGVAE